MVEAAYWLKTSAASSVQRLHAGDPLLKGSALDMSCGARRERSAAQIVARLNGNDPGTLFKSDHLPAVGIRIMGA
jgi:hypothetical protein